MNNTYGDWIFYGGLLGAFGAAITVYFYAKTKGPDKLTWKPMAIIIAFFMFPTVILPILLMPGITVLEKAVVTIALILFGVVRYYATTKGQEVMAKLREKSS